jgi:hypothetical protein
MGVNPEVTAILSQKYLNSLSGISHARDLFSSPKWPLRTLKINILYSYDGSWRLVVDDRGDLPYRSARSFLPGCALVPISQFGVQMKPAVRTHRMAASEVLL